MSRQERWGDRDLSFSRWHRRLVRDDLTWIDIDHCAYCKCCREVLFVMELARDVGQEFKTTTVTRQVANGLSVPGLLVFYRVDSDGEIDRFRIRRIAPKWGELHTVEPQVLADWIERQHDVHVCSEAKAA